MAVAAERAQRLFDHAHPHAKLVPGAPVGVFDRDRFRLIDGTQTLKMDFGRDHEIVNHVVGQSRMADSPHCVHAAADADECAYSAFATLQEFFVFPIGATSLADGRRRSVHINELTRDTSHFGVSEATDYLAYRVRLVHRRRVGEDQDGARRGFDGAGLRDGLAEPLRLPAQYHALRAEAADDLVSPIRRTVGRDYDLHPVARVIERERVFQLSRDIALFVVCRDDDRYARRDVIAPYGSPEHQTDREHQSRIAGVNERHHRHYSDKDGLGDQRLSYLRLREHVLNLRAWN